MNNFSKEAVDNRDSGPISLQQSCEKGTTTQEDGGKGTAFWIGSNVKLSKKNHEEWGNIEFANFGVTFEKIDENNKTLFWRETSNLILYLVN